MIQLFLRMQEVAIFLLAVFLGFSLSKVISFVYDYNPKKIEKITTKKGYHFHHSIYGLTSFFAAPIMINRHHVLTTLMLIGLGLGIIIEHTIQCGFVFLTKKDSKDKKTNDYTEDKELYLAG